MAKTSDFLTFRLADKSLLTPTEASGPTFDLEASSNAGAITLVRNDEGPIIGMYSGIEERYSFRLSWVSSLFTSIHEAMRMPALVSMVYCPGAIPRSFTPK